MAAEYPENLDELSNVADGVDYPKAADINDLQDAVEALEAKVGVDDSAVATSVDYHMNATEAHSATGAVVGTTNTQTLTDKRITKRVASTASASTPTPTSDDVDMFILTALAGAATFGAPTGTPTQGQTLIIRIKDNGTARALGWNAIYRALGTTLPTTTVLGKTLYLLIVLNDTDTKWDCLASCQEV